MGFRLDKIVVCGVGLIGGSFALALKKAGVAGQVIGIGRSQATLDEALRLGISGVPFFIFDGRYGLGGAQPPEVLLDALRRSLLPPTP